MHLPELAGGTGLLLLTAINAPVSPWISRKIVHMGVGTLLLNADISDPSVVSGIYTAGAGVIGGLTVTNGIKHISFWNEIILDHSSNVLHIILIYFLLKLLINLTWLLYS